MKKIRLGHTPDADDAFMFYGLASGKIASEFEIEHFIEDIESLNKRAINHELDVTAVSAHAYAYLHDYVILRSGSSFGIDYGPIVIAPKESGITKDNLSKKTIAIPGRMTSANLLLQLAIGRFAGKEVSFEKIPDSVRAGTVDAGLIIHEAQITYDKNEFDAVLDLGKWWSNETQSLPVPLGINVASTRTMTDEEIQAFSTLFAQSIDFGLKNIDAAVDYAMKYGRNQPRETIRRFVKMYVNDFTTDMGPDGRKSVGTFFDMAYRRGLLERLPAVKVV
ncbi:MAG: MqnA/MqnD/SBP family protein [Nitrososphaera sp.]|jgi:1,4-dihydroxy-6-naphthoate synthase